MRCVNCDRLQLDGRSPSQHSFISPRLLDMHDVDEQDEAVRKRKMVGMAEHEFTT